MKLLIVESPAKAKTINQYLGKDFKVIASKGHIFDLPKSKIGIDVNNNFKADYELKNKERLQEIKKLYKECDNLFLAMDPDREGEAIAWHIANALGLYKSGKKAKNIQRIAFTEITKDAIQKAIQHPRDIDMDLVNAQQTRRILDRLVGYELSPLLWKKLWYGLSAGRVQSVALRLVVEKELEREAFNKEEFWHLYAYLSSNQKDEAKNIVVKTSDDEKTSSKLLKFGFIKNKSKSLQNKKDATAIVDDTVNEQWKISSIDSKEVYSSPKSPFSTSLLQQNASNKLGMGVSRTMRVAQKLYEGGFITYMRTDSITISNSAIKEVRDYISQTFGQKYLYKDIRSFKTKSKVAQEAHEAIRPTNINKKATDLNLSGDESRLYDLIWKNTIASQMSEMILDQLKITVKVKTYDFILEGQRVVFDGFNKLKISQIKEFQIPKLSVGQTLFLNTYELNQKWTEPPARYSEATLVKTLEKYGIGRPSTYAPILTNILSRKYIEKDGKYLKPTPIGRVIVKLLTENFSKIVDVKFTAGMENGLDDIANGNENWLKFLNSFYKDFAKSLSLADKNIKKEKYLILGESEEKCPDCKKKMQVKLGRYGAFLTCRDFPKCKGIKPIKDENEKEIDQTTEEFKEKYKKGPLTKDGRVYLLKKGRFGYFWAHPDYPKVKDAQPLELTKKYSDKVFGKAPKSKDGKVMKLRKGRFGYFWAHPNYPDKKELQRIDNKLVEKRKEELELL